MLNKSGTIFISTRLPDGSISRTPIRASGEYFIDIQKDKTLVTAVDSGSGIMNDVSKDDVTIQSSNPSIKKDAVPAPAESANPMDDFIDPGDLPQVQVASNNQSKSDKSPLPANLPYMQKNPPRKEVPCEAKFQKADNISANTEPRLNHISLPKLIIDPPASEANPSSVLRHPSSEANPALPVTPDSDPYLSELKAMATTPPKPPALDDFGFDPFDLSAANGRPKSFNRRFQSGQSVPKPPYSEANSEDNIVRINQFSNDVKVNLPAFSFKPTEDNGSQKTEDGKINANSVKSQPQIEANNIDKYSATNEAYNIAQKKQNSLSHSHQPVKADLPNSQPQNSQPDMNYESRIRNYEKKQALRRKIRTFVGIALLIVSVIGISAPYVKKALFEGTYKVKQVTEAVSAASNTETPLPPAVPVDFNPLVKPDGSAITPVNTEFSLIIPRIGVNAEVEAKVDPSKPETYNAALKRGVAHASTSVTPDAVGTVYLFSHSTNYQWFVDDLNAIFYLVKDLEVGDNIVVFYKGVRYTYRMTGSKIVKPNAVSYLIPDTSKKSLILQTCWPPGSTTERMLIFADLIDERGSQI